MRSIINLSEYTMPGGFWAGGGIDVVLGRLADHWRDIVSHGVDDWVIGFYLDNENSWQTWPAQVAVLTAASAKRSAFHTAPLPVYILQGNFGPL